MTDKLSLSKLNERLSRLEGQPVASSSVQSSSGLTGSTCLTGSTFLTHLQQQKELETKQIENEVKALYQEEISKKNLTVERIMDVIEFTVDFVEKVAEYVPKVVNLIGSALKGEYKFALAMDLISSFFGDIGNLLSGLPFKHVVDKMVEIKYNNGKIKQIDYNKHEVVEDQGSVGSQPTSVPTSVPKNKKKGGSRFAFIGRKSKTTNSDST